jgi:hypothetical protein
VDYEPESPPSFSPAVEEFSEPEDRVRTPVPGQADSSASEEDFHELPAEDAAMAGRKRLRIFRHPDDKGDILKDESAAPPRKGSKTVIPAEQDKIVANLPRSTLGGSKPTAVKDESAAPSRKGGKTVVPAEQDESVANLPRITSGGSKSAFDKDELAAPPRKGGKSIIPAKRDDDLANLPISTLEGCKLTDPDGGRFEAIRGTGSNAPGFTDERNPRPSWLCVDEVPVGNNLPYKEGISQEHQVSDEVDKAPQQRAGPFPFETPRIQKSDGPSADPSLPNEPISIRKVPQQDVASYALPGKPNRQLTKDDLGSYNFQLLNAIEAVANSLPYLGNEVFRNDLIRDNELRTSTALTCFFLDGEVTKLL